MLRTFEGKDVPQKPTKKYENGVGVGQELILIVIEDLYSVYNTIHSEANKQGAQNVIFDRNC